MTTTRTCPECGAKVPDDAPEGLCPACLVQGGMATGYASAHAEPVEPAPALDEVARLFPELEVLELLGRGGMGAVYKARQPRLDRVVALKVLPASLARTPGFAERFAREARALARLNHPNIVTVHDFGSVEGADRLYYLIMEYVDGSNLRQLIASRRLTPEEALAIVPKLCEALQFAHDEGVLHRDVKPENILVDRRGRVKVADFGLAKLSGGSQQDVALTRSGVLMGTPRYMAPEQLEDARAVDHRADIYSLGVVFYEMLTGELPLGRFAPPSQKVEVDVRLDEVVLHALEKDPERRYQHASEVKDAVERLPRAAAPPAPGGGGRLGALSVAAAIAGVALPLVLGPVLAPLVADRVLLLLLCLSVGATFELAAFGCGLVSRRSATGRAGLVASTIALAVGAMVLAGGLLVTAGQGRRPAEEVALEVGGRPLAASLLADGDAWVADCAGPQTLRLHEVADPGVDGGVVTYRARVRTAGFEGRVYLEMWCRLPGSGEFFSRGLDQAVTGSTEGWVSLETPFILKPGQRPDLLKLNLVVEGTGRVAIRDVQLTATGRILDREPG